MISKIKNKIHELQSGYPLNRIHKHNLLLALKCQLPWKRFFVNFFITGNAWGMFHINSHTNAGTGRDKISYSSQISAERGAMSMTKKYSKHFSVYKCVYCDGYHIGKNRDNK